MTPLAAAVEINALFFDMDGVLIDVSRSYRRAIEETVAYFTGREIESGMIQRYKNLGGFNDDWKLTHAIVSDAGIRVSLGRVAEEFQRRYHGEHWDGFIAEEEPLIRVRTLEELSKHNRVLGIVTGRPGAEANWTLDRLAWKRYFPLVIPKEKQEGREKPDPFPLLHALAILDAAGRKISPESSMYVGDTVDDIQCARSAGMWAVGVVPPYVEKAAHEELLYGVGAHHVISDPNTLPDILERIGEILTTESADEPSEGDAG